MSEFKTEKCEDSKKEDKQESKQEAASIGLGKEEVIQLIQSGNEV